MALADMTLDQKINALARLVREGSLKAEPFASTVFPECYVFEKEGMGDGEGLFVARKEGRDRRSTADDIYILVSNGIEIREPAGAIFDLYEAITNTTRIHRALDAFLQ